MSRESTGGGGTSRGLRRRAAAGLTAGSTFTVRRRFTEADMRAFGALTRDYNPVHYEQRFAAAKGMSARICHGLLVASLITEIGGQIGWLASGMNFRFLRPVYFGDTVACTMTVTAVDAAGRARAEADYRNQEGTLVLTAELYGMLPSETDRGVLRRMLAEGDPTNPVD